MLQRNKGKFLVVRVPVRSSEVLWKVLLTCLCVMLAGSKRVESRVKSAATVEFEEEVGKFLVYF